MAELWDIYQNVNQLRFPKQLLQCALCEMLLTSPIYFHNQTGNICKTCKTDQEIDASRNEPLETALQKTLLPCKYGCQKLLSKENINKHQWNCTQAPIKCPKCKSNGFKTITEVINHCSTEHSLITIENVEVPHLKLDDYDFEDGIKMTLFSIQYKGSLFMAKVVQPQWNILQITMCHPQGVKVNYDLLLKIKAEFQTILTECKIANSWNALNSTNDEQSTKIYLTEVYKDNNNGTKEIDIELCFNSNSKVLVLKDAENFRKDIECPICMHYFWDDIFKCPNGHNVCGNCKKAIDTCPLCRTAMNDIHDTRLENILPNITLDCRNSSFNCLIVSDLKSLQEHEMNCPYNQYNCDYENCKFEANQAELIKHYIYMHKMYDIGTIASVVNFNNDLKHIIFGNYIFSLNMGTKDNDYQWQMSITNSMADAYQFVFDIELLNSDGIRVLCLTNTCKSAIIISTDNLKQICHKDEDGNDVFDFKCFIRKINLGIVDN